MMVVGSLHKSINQLTIQRTIIFQADGTGCIITGLIHSPLIVIYFRVVDEGRIVINLIGKKKTFPKMWT